MTHLTPEHEDPVVHRYLASLTAFAPSSGFAERVLADVVLPKPLWQQRLSLIRTTLFNRQTRWVWAAGMAGSSIFSFIVYSSLVTTHGDHVASTWSTFVRTSMIDAWRSALAISDTAASGLLWAADAMTAPGAVGIALLGSVALVVGCAMGLRHTWRSYNAERSGAAVRAIH